MTLIIQLRWIELIFRRERMGNINILFPIKLTQKNLEGFISEYLNQTLSCQGVVTFNFSILEWISSDGVLVILSWIRRLKLEEKIQTEVKLPYRNEMNLCDDFDLFRRKYTDYKESSKSVERRRRRSSFLIVVWGLVRATGLSIEELKNSAEDSNVYNREIDYLLNSEIIQKVIPFSIFESSSNPESFIYSNIGRSTNVKINSRLKTLNEAFKLENDLITFLELNFCYSPFESKILSHIIADELFLNTQVHAFKRLKRRLKEGYFNSIISSKRTSKSKSFLDSLLNEKDSIAIDFYRDKQILFREMKGILKNEEIKIEVDRKVSYRNFNSDPKFFKNQSYLEFNYLDFGAGICKTLKKSFEQNKEKESNSFSPHYFTSNNEDCKILEYSLQLISSSNPIENFFENGLIPRGLFFLLDMVRRYKGLLIIRSGTGKVYFDFSPKIVLKSKSQALEYIENPTIKESITYSIENLGDLPGSMFSIVLPQLEMVKTDPVRIDDFAFKVINSKPSNRLSLKEEFFLIPDSSKLQYISMSYLYYNCLRSENKGGSNHSWIYGMVFKEIYSRLEKNRSKNGLILIDFSGFKTDHFVRKMLFYLTTSPLVSESSKLMILNLESADHIDILRTNEEDFLNEMEETLNVNNEVQKFVYKAIPCFDLSTKTINWIGLVGGSNIKDQDLMSKLLFSKQEIAISKEQVGVIENFRGHLFAIENDHIYPLIQISND